MNRNLKTSVFWPPMFILLITLFATGWNHTECQNYFQNVITLDSDNGFVNPYVTGVLQDFDGFLWVGTVEGLHRLTGNQIEYIPEILENPALRSSTIDLFQSKDSTIWITTQRGHLCGLDPRTNNVICYSHDGENKTGLDLIYVSGMVEDDNNVLWLCAAGSIGLAAFDLKKKEFMAFPLDTSGYNTLDATKLLSTKRIIQDRMNQDLLWITSGLGLLAFDKKTGKYDLYNHGIPSRDNLTEIYQTEDENIWCGSYDGLMQFNTSTKTWNRYLYEKSPNGNNFIVDLAVKSSNEIWISALVDGPGIFNTITKEFQWISEDAIYFRNNRPLEWFDLLFTPDQILWVGTSQGLTKLDPLSNQFINVKVGINEPGRSIWLSKPYVDDRGHIKISASNRSGWYEYDENLNFIAKHSFASTEKVLNELKVRSWLKIDSKHAWIVGQHEIYDVNLGNYHLKPVLDGSEEKASMTGIIDAIVDQHDNLWIGTTGNGLFHYQVKNKTLNRYFENSTETDSIFHSLLYISDIMEDRKGNIWFSGNWGVNCIQNDVFRNVNLGGAVPTRGIAETQDGTIWIATHGYGLFSILSTDGDFKIDKKLTVENGLKSDVNYRIVCDQDGMLWFTHNQGLSRLDPVTLALRHFDARDGLPGNISLEGPLEMMEDGKILIVYGDRMTVFHPNQILSNQRKPEVYITSFKVFNEEKKFQTDVKYLKKVELSHQENFFSFNFTANNYSIPEKNQFAYILEGLESNWNYCNNCSTANYTNITSGSYTFRVKASNNDGIWNEQGVSLKINISYPYWQTYWFRGLGFLSALSLLFGLNKYRNIRIAEKANIRQKLNELELKLLRSQMNPHFMFNSLNSIKNFILMSKPQPAAEYLSNFAHLIRLILQHSRENLISLKEELETLLLYIDLEKMRFREGFDFSWKIADTVQLEHIEIPPMIIQPFVENAIWHGLLHKKNNRQLSLSIETAADVTIIKIDDNGIGRKKSAEIKSKSATKYKSMGLGITTDRIELLNFKKKSAIKIDIIDKENDIGESLGTCVVLRIPNLN